MLFLAPALAWAYDFAATVPSGQTLYFNYVAGGVEVVYPANTTSVASGWNGFTKPTGSLTVPATVSNGTSSLAVVSVANYAFYSCTGLTAVVLPEGLTQVGIGSFYQCSGVTALTLPSTLVSVGNGAFTASVALTDVWCQAALPPVASTSAFYNTDLSACTLHVPCDAVAAYSADAVWGAFGTVVGEACTVTISVTVNNSLRGSVTGGGTYPSGTLVTLLATPAAGYCFVCWNDGDTLNPRIVNAVIDSVFTAMFFRVQVDTVIIDGSDTLSLHDTILLTDTVYLTVPVHDTTYVTVPVHDTTYVPVHDTVVPTFFQLTVTSSAPSLGLGVGSALLPAGTVVEVCALPLEGGRFAGWADGESDNPRRLTVTGATTLTALFEQQSLAAVEGSGWTLNVSGRRLLVDGVAGQEVSLYDATGRLLFSRHAATDTFAALMPAAGVYLVRVGQGAARRFVIEY